MKVKPPLIAHRFLQHIEPEDLLSLGFIPEFIGRLLPMVTVVRTLTEDQLVSILTEPKNALVKQFAKLLAMEGVELEFSDGRVVHTRGPGLERERHGRESIARPVGARDARCDVSGARVPTTSLP